MRRPRGGQTMLLGDVLRAAFERASTTIFGDRVALYLVGLRDDAGFALALAAHAKVAGPDPAILRERSQERGVREPMMVGSAPVELLARVVEEIGGGGGGDRAGGDGGRGEPEGGRGRSEPGASRRRGVGGPGYGGGRAGGGKMLGFTIREFHREGEVPVLVITEGVEVVTTLEALAGEDGAELLAEDDEVPGPGGGRPRKGDERPWAGGGRPRNEGTGRSVGLGAVLADEGEPALGGSVVSPAGEA